MQPYSVQGTGTSRVLTILAREAHRFRFSHIIDGIQEDVKWQHAGNRLVAVVSDCVMVYKLPKAHEFHREYMAHNARAQWCGIAADPERLLNNMLEFHERI